MSDLHSPTPAIVSQLAARRFPRWILLLLGLIYVLPGLLGRQPWSGPDLASFGVMLDMAQGSGDWLQPQVLGERAADFLNAKAGGTDTTSVLVACSSAIATACASSG